MQLGLWFEPEMANPQSVLLRGHPERLLARPGRSPRSWRKQQTLDLARSDVYEQVLGQVSAVVAEYDLDYLKWDHNRDLHEAEHDGRPGVHAQTTALYRMLDELRARHPGLEIESCASGGARVDLGILERTDRVWASDTNDAVERQHIQRWTGLLLPPELVGAHVGPPIAHTTGRAVELSMRLVTALFGHAGIEWDISTCTEGELEQLRAWTAVYRELRSLLHTGRTVRVDLPDSGALMHGVVAPDQRRAVYAVVRLTTGPDALLGPVQLPGLDPRLRYGVRVRDDLRGGPVTAGVTSTPAQGVELDGRVLAITGVLVPQLRPAQAVLIDAMAL
jgi:alpha-galactosidase